MAMNIHISRVEIEGPLIIEPDFFQDERGFFFESYSRQRFSEHGIDIDFVQDNHSRSSKNVLRGLHFQDSQAPQWRLVRCTLGRVWDVIVDLRASSQTFGQWYAIELTSAERRQLLIPPEFAHGFCVLSEVAEVQYKCSHSHVAGAERTLAWDDPEVCVPWPIETPLLSQRDRNLGSSLQTFLKMPVFP
jgi:dTDP-4-dehydrorhamnose 3,5-epimerase